MKLAPIAVAMLATAGLVSSASARGTLHLLDPAWNPEHIRSLPAQVRSGVAQMCAHPQAEHQFASYSQGTRTVVLHFEHFRCGERAGARCTQAGCLHQVYTSTDGRYRLQRSYYATDR